MSGEIAPTYMNGVNSKIKIDLGAGAVVLPTKTHNVKDGSGKFDATNPTTAGWGLSESTVRQFTGSFEAFVPAGSAPLSMKSGGIYAFETDRGDGYGWSFDALVSDIDHKYDGKGDQSFTGTFESHGEVTELAPGA